MEQLISTSETTTSTMNLDSALERFNCDVNLVKQKLITDFPLETSSYSFSKLMISWNLNEKDQLQGFKVNPHITILNWLIVKSQHTKFLFEFDFGTDIYHLFWKLFSRRKIYEDSFVTENTGIMGEKKSYFVINLALSKEFQDNLKIFHERVRSTLIEIISDSGRNEVDVVDDYSVYNHKNKFYIVLYLNISGEKVPYLLIPLYDFFPSKIGNDFLAHFSLGEKKDYTEIEINQLNEFYSANKFTFKFDQGKFIFATENSQSKRKRLRESTTGLNQSNEKKSIILNYQEVNEKVDELEEGEIRE